MSRIRIDKCRNCKELKGHRLLDLFEKCCSKECLAIAGPYISTNTNNIQPKLCQFNQSGRKRSRKPVLVEGSRKHRSLMNRRRRQRYNNKFYKTNEWYLLRQKVLSFYGRKCMACSLTRGTMHVDHIVPRSWNKSLELEFSNLQVLCQTCNETKFNYNAKDYRPK